MGLKRHINFPKSAAGPQLLIDYVNAQLMMQNENNVKLFSLHIFCSLPPNVHVKNPIPNQICAKYLMINFQLAAVFIKWYLKLI